MTNQERLPSAPNSEERRDGITPLEGEMGIPSVTQAKRSAVSWKGIFAVALLVFSLVAVTAAALNRAVSGHKKDDADGKRTGERPMAAAAEPRKLDMTLVSTSGPAASA